MTKKAKPGFKPAVVGGKDKEAEEAAMAEAEKNYRAAIKGEVLEIANHLIAEADNIEGLLVLTMPHRDGESDAFMSYRNSGVDNSLLLWCGIVSIISARLNQDAIECGREDLDTPGPAGLH